MAIHEKYTLTYQSCYKVTKGEGIEPPLRLGRLDEELVYRNQKCINTIYGENKFIPLVTVEVIDNEINKYSLNVTISDKTNKQTLKQFVIRTQVNNLELSDIKEHYDKIKTILDENNENTLITLIEYIRNSELIYEEYC